MKTFSGDNGVIEAAEARDMESYLLDINGTPHTPSGNSTPAGKPTVINTADFTGEQQDGRDVALVSGEEKTKASNGDDIVIGDNASNKILAGKGDDVIDAGAGNDKIRGGKGDDVLIGGEGNDRLSGGRGDDILLGGEGNDVLHDNSGINLIDGGEGTDRAVLNGRAEDYTFMKQFDGSIVIRKKGVDSEDFQTTLRNVEEITFKNKYTEGGQKFNADNKTVLIDELVQLDDFINAFDGQGVSAADISDGNISTADMAALTEQGDFG